jgi:hypothetical protein
VHYEALPPENQHFVDELARNKGVASEITAKTPVLSLLGTQEWKRRGMTASRKVTSVFPDLGEFLDSIPMISRL